MKSNEMLILTNMLAKIISEVDDLKSMLREMQYENFKELYAGEEE